jgi:NDP-sugar pyrophosphorylase family protein
MLRAFSGIQVLTPKIFDYMSDFAPTFSIIDAYMNAARAGEVITECDVAGAFWCDMGSPEKLLELRKRFDAVGPGETS